jgi:Outer membrane protein and related peptidoglycan-associated (lipo)proteins
MMAIKKCSCCLAVWACLWMACPVFASINTDGQNGLERTTSAKPFGKATLNFGITADYAQSMDYVKGPTFPGYNLNTVYDISNPSSNVLQDPAKMISSDFYMALGLTDFWDFSLALPFYYDWAGFEDVRDGGLGDLEITTKFLFPPVSLKKLFYQSLVLTLTVPTGMRGNGLFPRQTHFIVNDSLGKFNPAVNFYSTDYISLKSMLAFTLDLGPAPVSIPLQIHLNVGGVFTEANKQNTIVGAIAVEYKPTEFLTLFADFSGESRWKNLSAGYNIRKDPLWATPGIRITTPSGVYLSLAGDFSMSSTKDEDRLNWDKKGYRYSTGVMPLYGVRLSFGWNGLLTNPDKMKEGLTAENIERCSNRSMGSSDAVEDADGCPDYDNDKIGSADSLNRCWKTHDEGDVLYVEDGCPDPDNYNEMKDQCSNTTGTAEGINGMLENNGCPDYEDAFNGPLDSTGRCFSDPDELGGFQYMDGCPDFETNKKANGNCSNVSETGSGYRDDSGCPDTVAAVAPKKGPEFLQQQILEGLEFKNGKAELLFTSYSMLDRLAKSLKDNPGVEIEIRGYTDGLGKASANTQLSRMRAEAVRQYLVNQGIDPQRVRAMGFGPNNPIGDNRTAAGRALNRRIEVVRTK